jgi:diguanylate cyclase (GGDEF)-like protein
MSDEIKNDYPANAQPFDETGDENYQARVDDNQTIKKLQQKINENPKTGLPNEKALKEFIENYDRRRPYDITATYMDLRGFGEINRNFGHDVGDIKLIEFSQGLKERTRKTDFLFSPHGDEFVLLSIFESNQDDKTKITREKGLFFHIQTINNELETKFDFVSVTFDPDKHTSLNDAIKEADLILMKKKEIAREEKAQQNPQNPPPTIP